MSDAAEAILSELDAEQREVALAVRGPVCVLAGAGTGKTRAITHRIAYAVHVGAIPPGQVLAVTFTSRAAGQMRTRLHALGVRGVQARTFHAAALRQLRYFAPRVLGGPAPDLVENKIALVGQAAARCRLGADRTALRDLAAEVEWAKSTLVTPEEYPGRLVGAGRVPPVEAQTVARVYRAYEDVKARAGMLDFEDLLMVTASAIEEHRDVADEVWARYRHLVVDEYQDVTPIQQRLLDAWLGGRDDVCVVGDANQTIYSFTGASPRHLLDFPRRYPGATVVRLERDYRSTPQVVTLANRLIGASGGRAGLRLVGQRPAGPEPTFTGYDDEPAEAAGVAAGCAKLVANGVPPSEIAVLFRVNAQSEAYERALSDAGLAYLLRGGERFFERAEIRAAVMLLRGAARAPGTDGALADAVRDVLAGMGWSALARPSGGAARERWESLAALVAVAEQTAAGAPAAGLVDLVAELDQRAASQHVPTVQGVTLASLHAAKGLEWDAVFLVGLVEGTVPIQYASSDHQVEEERRLLYVGMTRAREHLSLSWSLARTPGGRRSRRPSRFLQSLDPPTAPHPGRRARVGQGGSAAAVGARAGGPVRCRICGKAVTDPAERTLGRCRGCPADLDAELFERLRRWRQAEAGRQGVPAFVVLTDATLVAIAETRPADTAGLVAIPGIGQRKLDRYGAAVLSLVRGQDPSGEVSSEPGC
ncbi:MAG TPA: ATP-dependent DNA helicase UvrD2 [Mycobacteriales bacterium]|nr:ATP-dependent DNA helicase UvrD2 [Mycobacteriales bacterium]